MRNAISLISILLLSCNIALANNTLKKISSFSELDFTARKVQFKNLATGQYISVKYNPDGSSSLAAATNINNVFWHFNLLSQGDYHNVEIKKLGDESYKWLNYKEKNTRGIHIGLGKGPTTSNAYWTIESEGEGVFRISDSYSGESLEINTKYQNRIEIQPSEFGNENQLWEIYTDKKKNDVTVAYAIYASDDKEVIVTKEVRALVEKGNVRFVVKNNILGTNFYTGKKKKLTVMYKKNGAVYTKTCFEQDIFEF